MNTLLRILAVLAIAFAGTANAQSYPQRVVKVVVPFAPGGPSDIVGRVVAQMLSDSLGQSFLVENRAGAGGNIGTVVVAKSAPDGYTLLVAGTSQFTVNPSLYKVLNYDFQRDFTSISQLAVAPSIFVIHPDSGIKTIGEFVTRAKASPGKFNMGNSGMGSPPHIASELLMVQAGIT